MEMIAAQMLLTSNTSLSSLLNQCSTTREVKQFHAHTIKTGHFYHDPSTAIRILETCCSSFQFSPSKSIHDIHYSLSIFDRSVNPSSFVYNTLIRAFTQVDQPEIALLLFYHMLHENFPDKFTFPSVLKSCAQLSAIDEGEQMHGFVLKTQFVYDPYVQNCLIYMYAQCGKIENAYKLFEEIPHRNLVSWNSMIDGFLKSGDIDSARKLFDKMPQKDIVSWNSMIAGYADGLLPNETLELLSELQVSGLKPDEFTIGSIMAVISDLGLLSLGKRVHGYITRHEFSMEGGLSAALIDMYSKCGSIHDALQIFKNVRLKNVAHWTSMIVGLAVHGYADASLHLFSEMQKSGVKPNSVTFIGVLSACRHGGLVEEGLKHFALMRRTYNIEPNIQHFGCLVDLLGRFGHLNEAKTVIENMPMEPGPVIWSTLLAACKNHGDIEIGEIAAKKIVELTPDYSGGYVLLSNLYAKSGRWEDFGRTRRVMGKRGLGKVSGLSWIEVDGEIHEFLMGDKFHSKTEEIYRLLGGIEYQLRWTDV